MPVIVDQINDMIKAGVPVDQINKFKENKVLEMRQADIPPEKILENIGSLFQKKLRKMLVILKY